MPTTRSQARLGENHVVEADPNLERSARKRVRGQRQRERVEQEALRMAELRPQEIKMRDRAIPNVNDFRSSIAEPQVDGLDFELKPGLIQMVQQSQFGGSPMENPNVHLQRFLQMCNTVKMNGVPSDTIRLQLFPFSLRDKATEWLMSMPPNHFTTWDELSRAYLAKYFPPSKTAKIRHELNTFTQREGESLYEAWERLKDLQRQCPHHSIPEWLVIENFYTGLDQSVRSALDSAAGGSLMGKSDVQAKELIEEMALHNYQYGNPRGRSHGMFEVEAIKMLTTKLDQISHKVDSMQVNHIASSSGSCGACGMMGHQTSECLQFNRDASVEEVDAFNARPAGNPYLNMYNSSWRNNENFPSSSVSYPPQSIQDTNHLPDLSNQYTNQSYQAPMQMASPAPQKSRTEELLEQLLVSQQKKDLDNEQKFQQLFSKFDQLHVHNRMLESQISQMSAGTSQRNYGKLPSQPEANPREGVNAIILRSGRQLNSREQEEEKKKESQPEVRAPKVSAGKPVEIFVDIENQNVEKQKYTPPPPYQPPLPFPQRIQKAKLEKLYGKFLTNVQKLSINVPFLEALTQVPSYATFLKELLTNKRKLEEVETVALTKVNSNGIQNKLPVKLQDPGSFSIPCQIGNYEVGKALCDLGASVSLIPLSICEELDMGEPKPTRMTLQMADRSIKHPVGIVENVPIKVGKFFIPVDFVVLDMEEDQQTPIILGRPFLATAGALIDVKGGKLTFRIGDETAEFNVFPSSQFPITTDLCFRIDNVERLVESEGDGYSCDDPLKAYTVPGAALVGNAKARQCAHLMDNTPELKGSTQGTLKLMWSERSEVVPKLPRDVVEFDHERVGPFNVNDHYLKSDFVGNELANECSKLF